MVEMVEAAHWMKVTVVAEEGLQKVNEIEVEVGRAKMVKNVT